jgi:hypothetical protein
LFALLLGACGGDPSFAPDPTGDIGDITNVSGGGPGPSLGGCPLFPVSAVFNTRIDNVAQFPVHASSAQWTAAVGAARTLHADWGGSENQADPSTYFGIPINLVDPNVPDTDWPTLSYHPTDPRAGSSDGVPEESDCALANAFAGHDLVRGCATQPPAATLFPFPREAALKAEGGTCNDARTCGDRHVLVVETRACRLWESFSSYKFADQWYAFSSAGWNLRSSAMRPDNWTSGDAAGLPIAPLLVRAAEASAGRIAHALRITFQDSVLARSHVWPARHHAGGDTPGGIPFGALLRLRADVPVPAGWTRQAQAIARAMQQYGLYVADIGSDLFVQGEPSVTWSDATITQIQTLRMDQFEFVDLGPLMSAPRFDANSYAASW